MGVRRVVWLLVTVGAIVTWCTAALSAKLLLGLNADMAVLFGRRADRHRPDRDRPLLRHIRPTGQSGSVLRWEGIVIDPIGSDRRAGV